MQATAIGRILATLEECRVTVASYDELSSLKAQLEQLKQRLSAPMRVAIVGFIKAGKSTVMNALLKEKVVAVGNTETTFNVNWFRYGEESRLMVHFKDEARLPEAKRLAELEALTCRNNEDREYLTSIKYIEVYYPNDILKTLEMVDTPGLGSIYKEDAQNTMNFLGMSEELLKEQTEQQASTADAILYLFSKSVSMHDADIIEQFLGPALSRANPINAMGVLTKVDTYWPQVAYPLDQGKTIAARLMGEHRIQSLLYNIYPVCGHLAWGSQTLTEEEWRTLEGLAAVEDAPFFSISANVQRFAEREKDDIPVKAAERRQLLERLGLYGITLARDLYRQGAVNKDALCVALLENSGLPTLCEVIQSHFGNRALLIKLSMGLQRITNFCFMLQQQPLEAGVRKALDNVGGIIATITDSEHSLRELQLLKLYYEGKIDFTEQEKLMLLQITGEFGLATAQRLGTLDASLATLQHLARQKILYWRAKVNDPLGLSPATREGARIMLNAYQNVMAELKGA